MRTRACGMCGDRMPLERVLDKDVGQPHRAPCGAWCYVGSGSMPTRLLHGTPAPKGKGPRDCPMGCEDIPAPDGLQGKRPAFAAPTPAGV